MAQETFRANLHANSFPFFSKNFGETVILQKYDQTYSRALAPNSENEKDSGVPQAYYMHNVLPTEYGYKSVSYRKIAQPTAGAPFGGSDVAILYPGPNVFNPSNRYWHTAYPTTAGVDGATFYDFVPPIGISTVANYTNTTNTLGVGHVPINMAYVQGLNFYTNGVANQIAEINYATLAITIRATGVGVGFAGLCASQGYLIAWAGNNVYWSSLTVPYDFTPSQVTGAGGGAVSGLRGTIVKCVTTLNGFIIFGASNAVFASYTGNVKYPFSFIDIKNAGGINSGFAAHEDGNSGMAYALSSSGLQAIVGNQAETVVPDLDLFVNNRKLEVYNLTANDFEYFTINPSQPSDALYMKVSFVAKRYLCISYGKQEIQHFSVGPPPILLDYYIQYEYVLVYDTVLLRWGKLKKPHVSVFTYTNIGYGSSFASASICLMGPDGNAWIVDLADELSADADAVLILGKYQRDRESMLNLQGVKIQHTELGDSFELGTYYTLDGKTKAGFVPGYLAYTKEGVRDYNFDVNALNHSIVLKGDFHVNSLLLTHTNGGSVGG